MLAGDRRGATVLAGAGVDMLVAARNGETALAGAGASFDMLVAQRGGAAALVTNN